MYCLLATALPKQNPYLSKSSLCLVSWYSIRCRAGTSFDILYVDPHTTDITLRNTCLYRTLQVHYNVQIGVGIDAEDDDVFASMSPRLGSLGQQEEEGEELEYGCSNLGPGLELLDDDSTANSMAGVDDNLTNHHLMMEVQVEDDDRHAIDHEEAAHMEAGVPCASHSIQNVSGQQDADNELEVEDDARWVPSQDYATRRIQLGGSEMERA